MDDPDAFYNRHRRVGRRPGPEASVHRADQHVTDDRRPDGEPPSQPRDRPVLPAMRLPGEENERRSSPPAVRAARRKDDAAAALTAFMVAKSDPDDYGKLETFVMPASRLPHGPQDVVPADPVRHGGLERASRCCASRLASALRQPARRSRSRDRCCTSARSTSRPRRPAVPQLQRVIVAVPGRRAGDVERRGSRETLKDALTAAVRRRPRTRSGGDRQARTSRRRATTTSRTRTTDDAAAREIDEARPGARGRLIADGDRHRSGSPSSRPHGQARGVPRSASADTGSDREEAGRRAAAALRPSDDDHQADLDATPDDGQHRRPA